MFNCLVTLRKPAESLLKQLSYIGKIDGGSSAAIGFSGTLPLGTPHSQRLCIFAICQATTVPSTDLPTTVTLGGVAATLVAGANNANRRVGIYQAAVPNGYFGTLSFGTTQAHHYLVLSFRAINLVSNTASDTASTNGASDGVRSTNIDAPTTGFVVGAACGNRPFGNDETWTGLTEVADVDTLGGSLSANGAMYTTPGATESNKAISIDNARALVAAAWA